MPERTHQTSPQPIPRTSRAAAICMAADRADHLTHCAHCREQDAETEARYAEYGASTARRDRVQLGLRTARTTAVRA